MSNTPIKIETDLSTVLERIEAKIDNLADRMTKLEIGKTEIKCKVDAIDKRLEKVENFPKTQIWALIGLLGTAILATVSRFIITALPSNIAVAITLRTWIPAFGGMTAYKLS